MRAVALTAPGRLEVRDIPMPRLRRDEILLRVSAVGVCGTDFHIYSGEANYNSDTNGRPIPLDVEPQVLGHEITGVVEELGAEVRDLRRGDRVIVDQGRNCVSEQRTPRCEYCATGDSHQCEHYREHGITGLPGGFAECVAVPAVNAVKLRNMDLDAAGAALAEPLACIIHSVDVMARAHGRYRLCDAQSPVRSILILGAGPSGLLFVQYLRRVAGFDGLLLVAEPNAKKRALARQFGADVLDASNTDLARAVRARTDGRGVDLVIEASGSASAFLAIPSVIRKQGTVALYGHGHGGADLSALNAVQFKEPTLLAPTGASGGFESDGRPTTYVRALRCLERGDIQVGDMITHRYHSLDDIPRAFAESERSHDYIKGVVTLQ